MTFFGFHFYFHLFLKFWFHLQFVFNIDKPLGHGRFRRWRLVTKPQKSQHFFFSTESQKSADVVCCRKLPYWYRLALEVIILFNNCILGWANKSVFFYLWDIYRKPVEIFCLFLLFRYRETRQKCARSWASAVNLMKEYSEMTFAVSQAQQVCFHIVLQVPFFIADLLIPKLNFECNSLYGRFVFLAG